MSLNNTRYLKVNVRDEELNCKYSSINYRSNLYDSEDVCMVYSIVPSENLLTAESIADCQKEEAIEEYRHILNELHNLKAEEREMIVGKKNMSEILKCIPAQTLISMYNRQPKVGQIWEDKDKYGIIVNEVNREKVNYWWINTKLFGCDDINDFMDLFNNTGKKCETIIPFLNELKELYNK